MVGQHNRRSAPALSFAALAGAGVWMFSSVSESFTAFNPRATRSNVARSAFNEEFEAWRKTLSKEEKEASYIAARNEFNKTYRKSDDFGKKDMISSDKMEKLSEILNKFVDTEMEEYNKEVERNKIPPPGLRKVGEDKVFTLRHRCVEIDRDADRKYKYASRREAALKKEGKYFFESSPLVAKYLIANNDTEQHDALAGFMKDIQNAVTEGLKDEEIKKHYDGMDELPKKKLEEFMKLQAPAVGEQYFVEGPYFLEKMWEWIDEAAWDFVTQFEKAAEKEGKKAVEPQLKHDVYMGLRQYLQLYSVQEWTKANDEVEKANQFEKDLYSSATQMPGKTKADVIKEIHELMSKSVDQPLAPLDEETLETLSQYPAAPPEGDSDYRNPWGFASKLYKSEAIDAWGTKYLLGIFETKEEAKKAYDDWNAEFVKARKKQDDELAEWSKQEQARLDKDEQAKRRIAEILLEAEGN